MLNEEVARIFENMARVLAFKGKDRFRIMAYERAAVSLRDLDEDLAKIADAGNLLDIPGVGHDLAEFGDHGLGVGQLPAQVVGVLDRRHGGMNPAPRSG